MVLIRGLTIAAIVVATIVRANGQELAGPAARAVATMAPAPEYPFEARAKNISGSGVVRLQVDPGTGRVTGAQIVQSSGNKLLDDAALAGFRQWRFKKGAVTNVRLPFTFSTNTRAFGVTPQAEPILPNTLVRTLFAGTSVTGKRLNAAELKPLIVYAPLPWGTVTRSRNWRFKIGVFLLSVRPDGTVAKVEKLQSTNHAGLDGEVTNCLKRWRFRPNSVAEVRVPAHYTWRP